MHLSDKLRDLRFAVRRVADLPRQANEHDRKSAIYNMADALANVSNRFLNTAESGLISMLSTEPEHHHGLAPAYGFDRYFALPGANGRTSGGDVDEVGPSGFAREQYFAAKRVLSMTGNARSLTHQENFLPVLVACERALGTAGETGWQVLDRETSLCRLAVAYTLATVETGPVLSPRTFSHPHLGVDRAELNVFVGASLALVGALAATGNEDAGSDILYTSAIAAVAARYRAVANALAHDDPVRALTSLYSRLLRHLP